MDRVAQSVCLKRFERGRRRQHTASDGQVQAISCHRVHKARRIAGQQQAWHTDAVSVDRKRTQHLRYADGTPLGRASAQPLVGVQLTDVAHAVALAADNGIWYEIGNAEAEIRTNPALANDPALAAALRGG